MEPLTSANLLSTQPQTTKLISVLTQRASSVFRRIKKTTSCSPSKLSGSSGRLSALEAADTRIQVYSACYVPMRAGCGSQRGAEAAAGAEHADGKWSRWSSLWETDKFISHTRLLPADPLPQKHMASPLLLTYPQCIAWTVKKPQFNCYGSPQGTMNVRERATERK